MLVVVVAVVVVVVVVVIIVIVIVNILGCPIGVSNVILTDNHISPFHITLSIHRLGCDDQYV